jgi:hypothetical protein
MEALLRAIQIHKLNRNVAAYAVGGRAVVPGANSS